MLIDDERDNRVSLEITSITFSGGSKVVCEPDDILVIVGPNNAGKSRALRDIISNMGDASGDVGPVVARVEYRTTGSPKEFQRWMRSHLVEDNDGSFQGLGGLLLESHLRSWDGVVLDRRVVKHLCLLATASERFALLQPVDVIDPFRDPVVHPIQALLKEQGLEPMLSSLVQRAFATEIIVNWGSGRKIKLHCGSRPSASDRVSREYLQALDALPTLEEQGDGLKSYFACLLQVMLGPWFVVLLDEPEMFLHPPQAELLGEILAAEVPSNRQLIIATHSSDLLRGLLKHAAKRIKLLRITRDGYVNNIHELAPARVAEMWLDPALSFTNVLDGLFRDYIVVCEGGSDCRFFDALLDASVKRGTPRPMFIPAGGKQGIKKLISALHALGVPCAAVTDFDVLNDDKVLQPLWEAAGGDWSQIAALWKTMRTGIESGSAALSRAKVLDQCKAVLGGPANERITEGEADAIRAAVKSVTAWAQVKRSGLSGLSQGQTAESGRKLLEILAKNHFYIIPVGELERFVPTIGGHADSWVTEVLATRDIVNDPDLQSAREFAVRLLGARNTSAELLASAATHERIAQTAQATTARQVGTPGGRRPVKSKNRAFRRRPLGETSQRILRKHIISWSPVLAFPIAIAIIALILLIRSC